MTRPPKRDSAPADAAAAASSLTSLPLASNVVVQSSVATVTQPFSANIVSVPSAAVIDTQMVVACTSSVDNRASASSVASVSVSNTTSAAVTAASVVDSSVPVTAVGTSSSPPVVVVKQTEPVKPYTVQVHIVSIASTLRDLAK